MNVSSQKFRVHFLLCSVIVCLLFTACSVLPAASDPSKPQLHSHPSVTLATTAMPEPTFVPVPSTIPSAPIETEPSAPSHIHDYSAQIVDPTCTDAGQLIRICECGDSYLDGTIDPLGHQYATQVTAPSCIEGGFTEYTCSACGDRYLDDRTAPSGHNWGAWETVLEPTVDNPGEQRRNCLNCDAAETKAIDKLFHQHRFTAMVTEPTCTGGGFTTYTCSCGETYTANETNPLGHSYIAQVTPPTCQMQGYTVYVCFCGEMYKGNYVEPLGHSFGEWSITKEPTADAEGEMKRICGDCGFAELISVEKLPKPHTHTYSKEKMAATCTAQGYTLYSCPCGDSYREEGAAATGHCWDHWLVTLRPTDTAVGQKERVCTVCNVIESDILDFVSGDCGFVIVDYPETVFRNTDATVRILGQPGITYDIDVYYKSGESSAKGLEDQIADENGYVTWTWKIGGRTVAGTFQIVVTGNGESQSVEFTVVVE